VLGASRDGEDLSVSTWIVTNIPSALLLPALMIAVAGPALLIKFLVRRRFPGLKGDAHNDVTRFAYGVIGFVYAFFVGFLANSMWGQINSADARAAAEGSAAMQLARSLGDFDKEDGDRIRESLLTYEREAIKEWRLAARGEAHPEAEDALRRLREAYRQVQPDNDAEARSLGIALGNLDKTSALRSERLFQAATDTGPPWSLWAVVFVTSVMVLGCAIIYGGEGAPIQYAMTATIGALVATNLFLILELSHPYLGDIGTSSRPLSEVIRLVESSAP
jgi:hypothetical protein